MVSILIENIDDILISTGMYPDKKTLLDDSLRALLRAKPDLLRTIAIDLYRRHEVSMSRAAEICGLNGEEFKELLRERGISLVVPPHSIHEMNADVDALLGAL
jgi:predicted HTH domain antitoxin